MNLSFPDIAIDSLERMLPDKNALVDLSTYDALYEYGYRNVYELGPLIDIRATRIAFECSSTALDKR